MQLIILEHHFTMRYFHQLNFDLISQSLCIKYLIIFIFL